MIDGVALVINTPDISVLDIITLITNTANKKIIISNWDGSFKIIFDSVKTASNIIGHSIMNYRVVSIDAVDSTFYIYIDDEILSKDNHSYIPDDINETNTRIKMITHDSGFLGGKLEDLNDDKLRDIITTVMRQEIQKLKKDPDKMIDNDIINTVLICVKHEIFKNTNIISIRKPDDFYDITVDESTIKSIVVKEVRNMIKKDNKEND